MSPALNELQIQNVATAKQLLIFYHIQSEVFGGAEGQDWVWAEPDPAGSQPVISQPEDGGPQATEKQP